MRDMSGSPVRSQPAHACDRHAARRVPGGTVIVAHPGRGGKPRIGDGRRYMLLTAVSRGAARPARPRQPGGDVHRDAVAGPRGRRPPRRPRGCCPEPSQRRICRSKPCRERPPGRPAGPRKVTSDTLLVGVAQDHAAARTPVAGRRDRLADDGARRSGRLGELGCRRPQAGDELLRVVPASASAGSSDSGALRLGGGRRVLRPRGRHGDGGRPRRRERSTWKRSVAGPPSSAGPGCVVGEGRARGASVTGPSASPASSAGRAVGRRARSGLGRGTGGSVRRPAACIVSMVPSVSPRGCGVSRAARRTLGRVGQAGGMRLRRRPSPRRRAALSSRRRPPSCSGGSASRRTSRAERAAR